MIEQVIDPNIPTMSPSQLAKYMHCPQEWYYGYREDLRRISMNTFHMDRGTYFHRLSHYYYNLLKSGYRPGSPTVMAAMDKKIMEDMAEVSEDNIVMLATSIPVFKQFIGQRSPVLDSQIKVLGVEVEFHHLVTTPKGRQIYLHGFIDLIYRNMFGKIRVRDHKTSERADSWSDYKVQLDNQLFLYNYVMWKLYNELIEEVEVNFINLAKNPKERFGLFSVGHSEAELEFYEKNLFKILDKVLDEDIYRNYSKDCSGCSYNKLCVLETKGLPTASTISLNYERTNRGFKSQPTEAAETIQGRTSGDAEDSLLSITL